MRSESVAGLCIIKKELRHMLKVAKFGGSSLAGAEQFKKVKDIIEADPGRMCVVVSAAGKRDKKDSKITDLLYLTTPTSITACPMRISSP